MRKLCCLDTASELGYAHLIKDSSSRQLSTKLSVDDILYLQQIFLTTGLHHIVAPNLSIGRRTMHLLLRSMNCFSNAACLTWEHKASLKGYDVLGRLIDYCGQEANMDAIEEYFIEEFEADFLWIEMSDAFMQNPFVVQAFNIMHVLNIIHKIPVVLISYQG
jgi:hypothetical protein